MISGPLISIVIPAYNCAAYVGETLDSIKAQTYFNWEVIFVNDGSKDQTPRLLEELAKSDTRIKVIHQTNGKQGKARNNGIRHAKGDWIAFLDADDIWPPEKLEVQLEKNIRASVGMSFTNGFICLENDMKRRDVKFGVEDYIYSGDEGLELFHAQNRVPTSSVLIQKAILDEISLFPEDAEIQNCEDYLLWTILLSKGAKLMGISEPLLYYRVHSESSTGQELKLLFPLLFTLIRMPGNRGEPLNTHLNTAFFRFLTLLQEQDRLKDGKELILKVLPFVFPGPKAKFLKFVWSISAPIGLRLTWRLV